MLRVIARLNVGGPALQAVVLSEGLDPCRFEQCIVAGSVAGDEGDFVSLRAPTLRVVHVPGLGRALRPVDDARAWATLVAVMRRFNPHVVHTHTAKAGALGRLAAWCCGVPATVHTFHGHLLHGYFGPTGRPRSVSAERMLARPATRLVAVGNRVKQDLLTAGIGRPEQFRVVPPGATLGPLPTVRAARQVLGLRAEAVVVALVARLTKVKRPERFVEMAGALARTHPDAVFVVAGDGELATPLRTMAERLRVPVRFLGWRSDIETVYAAADVVALTSDNEGMPVSLIEASLAGRPCVTTDVGGASEVVADGRTGMVTEPDALALSAAVGRLSSDPQLRRSMGVAAQAYASRRFGGRRLVSDIDAMYAELAMSPRISARGRS